MQEIIKEYQNGLSYKELALRFNISTTTVWRIIKSSNIKMKGSGSKPHLPNPFSSFSREANYWLGYIVADGSIVCSKGYRNYTLHLYSKNKDILIMYNNFMSNRCNINIHTKSSSTYSARTSDKQLCEWLINVCNITPNKALTLNPSLPITWDLLRGYFDGDGSVRMTGKHYEAKFTTGSKIWADRIKTFLEYYNINSVITEKGKAYDVNIYKKESVKLFYTFMYNDTNLYLQYKYARFDALFGDK